MSQIKQPSIAKISNSFNKKLEQNEIRYMTLARDLVNQINEAVKEKEARALKSTQNNNTPIVTAQDIKEAIREDYRQFIPTSREENRSTTSNKPKDSNQQNQPVTRQEQIGIQRNLEEEPER